MGTVTIYDKTSQIWFNELIRKDDGNVTVSPELENPAMPITYNDKGKDLY